MGSHRHCHSSLLFVVAQIERGLQKCVRLGGQKWIKVGCLMAIIDRVFVDRRRSKGFQWVPRVSRLGVQFYIWATAILCFAGTAFTKGGHRKGKITRSLGFYFGTIIVKEI
jgi:hypothetical protein